MMIVNIMWTMWQWILNSPLFALCDNECENGILKNSLAGNLEMIYIDAELYELFGNPFGPVTHSFI